MVHVDAQRLRQVLLNLVGNAVKFTDRGRVTLRAALAASAAAASIGDCPAADGSAEESGAEAPADEQVRVAFVVEDEGIGIDPDHLPVIFEPFRQLDGTLRRRHGGAGLGLAIVKRVVHALGGRVRVESEQGRGSRFTVELTMRVVREEKIGGRQEAAVGTISQRQVTPATRTPFETAEENRIRKVLIAEDNPVNQTLLARILKTRGLHVVAVANGQAAVEAVANETFDLILMDIQMPVMDGIEATRRIRGQETPGGARISIIAVTANGLFQCRQECMDVGMDGYVVKPFGPASLFDAIARVTQQIEGDGQNGMSGAAHRVEGGAAATRDVGH